ncbi:hypothetical protein ACFFGH_06690 [Lysobacter korlensis]|uniref:DUF4124 domain-containing protein n=1 Tax=Lysobacter korlensis TaxID=553636 RepID=A0ABV6RKM4_9GAMM
MLAVRAVLLLLLVGSASAHAQAIYKCTEKGKPVSYQTSPCPASAAVAGIKQFTPDRELTPAEKRYREAQWARRSNQAPGGEAAVIPIQHQAPIYDECADTKAARDRWEKTVGLERSYDALRTWNDHVAKACRH